MIDYYEFDNANVDGDKEAVIVPNPPTLVNKLSAHETNGIKDKINELVDSVNPMTPIAYLELRLKFKGEDNVLPTLQVGDIVHGFADADTIWTNARYEGGDINDRENYTVIPEEKPEPYLTTAPATGTNQVFTLPAGLIPGTVLKSKAELYKGSEWSFTGNQLTIIVNTNIGNSIYVKP